jgi:predicted Ser/Thr protein kinase/tetratricopeptide (TPR) repeat protein
MPTIARYQLLEKLGQGGMGIVYRAHDTLLQRIVAVKVISTPVDTDPEPRERFFREARAAGQLSHKNIITIYDLGEHEGQPYLAMEFLTGQDLAARMTDPQRMSLRRKLEVATEMCEGLDYAHAHGVVHRDIKPGNIFLTDSGTVKIVDFGLARLVTSDLTRSHMMMGTVNYMAPEQIRGERVDHRADIFSTGVVLYELLSGRRAFDGDSFASTLYRILEQPPEPLRNIDPTLPLEIVQIVDRALAKPRDERYQHTSEILLDLAVFRQQLTLDSPGGSRPAPSTLRVTSDAPAAPGDAPPTPTTRAATPLAAAASGKGPDRRLRTIALVVVAALALGAAALTLWMSHRAPPPVTTALAPASTPSEPPIGELMQRAMSAFEAEDYAAADRSTAAVLARDPGNAAAQQLRDRARTAASAVDAGLRTARALFEQGRFEEASRAAGEVLSVAPGSAEAKRIMEEGAAQSRGRGADEARIQVARAKAAARSANAPRFAPAPYAAAIAAERDALRLYQGARPGDATVKFYEASGLFRSAEVAAQNEATARDARAREARSARAETEKPAGAEPAAAPTSAPAAPPQPASPPPERTAPAPVPAAPPPASTLPLPAAPSPAPPPPPSTPPEASSPPPNPEAGLTELLARYKAALEARDLDALKRVWPGLSGAPQDALREEFRHASHIAVEILDPRITVSGTTGTVSFLRRYELLTVEGRRLRTESRTTMDARRTGAGWIIERIRFEPAR